MRYSESFQRLEQLVLGQRRRSRKGVEAFPLDLGEGEGEGRETVGVKRRGGGGARGLMEMTTIMMRTGMREGKDVLGGKVAAAGVEGS